MEEIYGEVKLAGSETAGSEMSGKLFEIRGGNSGEEIAGREIWRSEQ